MSAEIHGESEHLLRGFHPGAFCPCGCGKTGSKLSTKTGHIVRDCSCSSCRNKRNVKKGKRGQARTHAALGGQGFTPYHEESGTFYDLTVNATAKMSEKEREARRVSQRAYYQRNKEAQQAYAREKYQANPRRTKGYQLKKKYGITLEQYDAMVEAQAGRCAICEELADPLVVDHDHIGGAVRALLCQNCNRAIGLLRESPAVLERAVEYLQTHMVDLTVRPEVKAGAQVPANFHTFIGTDWFRRALSQSERSIPEGIDARPAVSIDGRWLVVDLRNPKVKP